MVRCANDTSVTYPYSAHIIQIRGKDTIQIVHGILDDYHLMTGHYYIKVDSSFLRGFIPFDLIPGLTYMFSLSCPCKLKFLGTEGIFDFSVWRKEFGKDNILLSTDMQQCIHDGITIMPQSFMTLIVRWSDQRKSHKRIVKLPRKAYRITIDLNDPDYILIENLNGR